MKTPLFELGQIVATRGAADAFLGVVGVTITLIQKLLRSPTEAARRARIVLGVAVAVIVGLMAVEAFGIGGALTAAAVGGALWWVYAGKGK